LSLGHLQQVRYPSNTSIVKRPSLLTITTIYLNTTRPYNVHYTSNMHSQFHLELIFQTAPASQNEAGLWNLKTPFYLVLLHSSRPTIFAFYHCLSARIDYVSEIFRYFAVWRHTIHHLIRGPEGYQYTQFFQHYAITVVMVLFTIITQLKNKETHNIITLYFFVIFYALMKGENNL